MRDHKKYYAENRERILDKQKRYRGRHPELVTARCREYYKKNREKLIEYQKKYYQEHKEELLPRMMDYYRAHRAEYNSCKVEAYWRKKRAV